MQRTHWPLGSRVALRTHDSAGPRWASRPGRSRRAVLACGAGLPSVALVDLYGAFEAGAVTNNEEYIALKHSADSRVLAKANTRDALSGNHFSIGVDVYLTVGQYVSAVCYQKNGTAAALTVTGRLTAHRIA